MALRSSAQHCARVTKPLLLRAVGTLCPFEHTPRALAQPVHTLPTGAAATPAAARPATLRTAAAVAPARSLGAWYGSTPAAVALHSPGGAGWALGGRRTFFEHPGKSPEPEGLVPLAKEDLEALPMLPVDPSRQIFVNNEFKMGEVDVIGFDYDYTLANYTERLPKLVYDLALDYLVDKLKYPSGFRRTGLKYDKDFAIRGLSFDKRTGLLFKMNSFSSITAHSVHRGRRRLEPREVRKIYGRNRHITMEYRDAHVRPLVDLFAVAEANVLSNLIQYFIDNDINYTPSAVSDDVNEAIEWVHLSGVMHNIVSNNLERFLTPSPELKPVLERFRADGKQLFLLTNSDFDFIDAGMAYLLGEAWRELFDYVLVRAEKPKFYTNFRVFRKFDTKRGRVTWKKVKELKKDKVYVQGSVNELVRMANWQDKTVLYIGDSMFSDWKEPAIAHGWIVGGIIRELEQHVLEFQGEEMRSLRDKLTEIDMVYRRAQMLDDSTPEGREMLLKIYRSVSDGDLALEDASTQRVLDAVERRRWTFRLRRQVHHNENFGSMFVSAASPTLFAFSLMRYVDFYTSHLTNFLFYPSDFRFSPVRRVMPHQATVEEAEDPTAYKSMF